MEYFSKLTITLRASLFAIILVFSGMSIMNAQTCIDLPPMDGPPGVNVAAPGYTVFQASPDIINGNGTWPGGGFVVSNVNGASTSGGTMALFLSATFPGTDGFWESWQTPLSGLSIGSSYTVAVEWQQASLDPGMYSGMQLRMGVTGLPAMNYSSTGGLDDTWQVAVYTFTATATTHNFVVGIAESGFRGAIVVDTGAACSIVSDPIPTMSQWALFILGLCLTSMAVVTIRKSVLAVS